MVANLAEHKNGCEEKRRKEILKYAHEEVDRLFSHRSDVRAFALVVLDSDGMSDASFDTGSIMPLWAFPSCMSAILDRVVESSGVEETWKPPLPIKG